MTCNHEILIRTKEVTSDGRPLYECSNKCGVGYLSVKPTEVVEKRGRKKKENKT